MHDEAVTTETPARSGRVGTFSRRALGNAALYIVYVLLFSVVLRLINPILLRYDDGMIMLVSYSWLNGFGFTNFWVSVISTPIFAWHGFMQPTLVAALSPCATLTCVNIGLVIIGIVYLLVVWHAAVNMVTESWRLRWVLYVIGVASVLQFSARPELVAALALTGITMVYLRMTEVQRFALRAALAGGLAGLTATTSPAAGMFGALGVAAATAYLRRSDTGIVGFMLEGTIATAAALSTAALLLLLVFPYDPMIWLEGIREATAVNSERDDTSGFFKYHFGSKLYPLQALLFIPLAAIAALGLKSVWAGGNRLLFVAFVFASAYFAYFLYYSAIRVPVTFYNFSALVPPITLIAIYLAKRIQHQERVAHGVLTAPVVLFALACGVAQIGFVVQKANAAPQHDLMVSRIASTVDRYLAEGRQVAMDPPLAVAVDDPNKLKNSRLLFFGVGGGKWPEEPTIDVLLRAQTEFGPLPAEVPGFRLVEDNFLHNPLSRFVKPLSLNFAIYEAAPGAR